MKKAEIPFERRLRVPGNVHVQEIDEEAVILNLDTDLYLGLNQSGTQILNEVSKYDSIQQAYEALLEKYEIDPERLRSELSSFLEVLVEHGIVELADP